MRRILLPFVLIVALAGCVTSTARIQKERQNFLKDPSMGSLGYAGVLTGGVPYRYLVKNDPYFGAYLLEVVRTTQRGDVALSALYFFAYAKSDHARFEEITSSLSESARKEELAYGETDSIQVLTLSEWITYLRNEKGWASLPPPTAVIPPAGQEPRQP